jgi:rhamnosyltransferase subunit B
MIHKLTAKKGNAMEVVPPRIIVATTGTGGDIVPFVTLAQELSSQGQRVTMLVPQLHEAFVKSHGLACEVFGTVEAFKAVLEDPNLWDERKGFGVVWKAMQAHFGVIRALVARQPAGARCVLVCHPILLPMADLAKSVRPDLRIVGAYLAPSNLCSSYDLLTAGSQRIPRWIPLAWRQALWRLIFKKYIDPVTLPSLNDFRAASGLAPVDGFFSHMFRVPDASIGLFPDWFAPVQPDWPAPFFQAHFPEMPPAAAASLSPELERFLATGDAPIAFTPGTGHQHAAKYFATAVETLKRLGRRGLLITPYAAQVPKDLPPGVMWVEQAPFQLLLPRLAALVHHGGIGTTAEAFRAGIPQLIAPYAFDQFDNGWRAHRLGVAEVLLPRQMSERRLRHRLMRLISSPDVARSCADTAARMAKASGQPLIGQLEKALGLSSECGFGQERPVAAQA